MIEREIAISPKRTVLTLPEAAALVGGSVEDLLLKGARGELRIYARVPEDIVVYSTHRGLIDLADPTLTGLNRKLHEDHAIGLTAQVARDIQLVELRKLDCASALAQGETYQSLFAAGVRIDAAGIPIATEPLAPKKSVGVLDIPPFRVFACYSNAIDPNNWTTRKTFAPVRLKLTIDAMRILRADLVPLVTVSNEHARFDIGFIEEPFMPQTLVKLYEAAMKHWDCSRPDWTPPEPMSVERSLLELGDYKGKLAEAGATLLRRSFANWNQRHYELRKTDGKLTPFESLVVVASAWRTSVGSKDDADNKHAQFRDKAKAFEYWLSFDIKEYLAQYAWRIASPKHARSTGRPRGK